MVRIFSYLYKKLFRETYSPGQYYHPVPDYETRKAYTDELLSKKDIPTINLNLDKQINFFKKNRFSGEYSFTAEKSDKFRYYSNNAYFNGTDGVTLYLIMRQFKPSRIIEVGSGFSSALMMDVNDLNFSGNIDITFVEPYPERLLSLMKQADHEKYTIIADKIQNVSQEIFKNLQPNDILFIDSSHVSKLKSDVNFIIFELLPLLNKGVLVHFHDICYPFEYPAEWIKKGIFWNEAYLLRAFLMYNSNFEILLFNHLLGIKHSSWFSKNLPHFQSGGSLWLRKLNK